MNETEDLNYVELATLVEQLLHQSGQVILRSTQDAGGYSIFTTDTASMKDLYHKIKKNRVRQLLVEPCLNVISSPNDQWVITRDGTIAHLGLSAQQFEGLKHAGNLQGQYYSPRVANEIREMSYTVVKSMAEHGYRGVLGIDYIVSEQGIFPIENNARFNGSTFSFGIVAHVEEQTGLKAPCWKFFNVRTEPCSYNQLAEKLDPILYKGRGINRVFPHDCDALEHTGVFAPLLIAEDMYHIQYLEESLKSIGCERL